MPEYTYKLYGTADVTAIVTVDADTEEKAYNIANHPDTLWEVEWKYNKIESVDSCYLVNTK